MRLSAKPLHPSKRSSEGNEVIAFTQLGDIGADTRQSGKTQRFSKLFHLEGQIAKGPQLTFAKLYACRLYGIGQVVHGAVHQLACVVFPQFYEK